MAETSRSFLETVGGVITIGGVVAGLTAYCVSLQFGLNQASREIERLDKQLSSISSTQAASQQGIRGPKGDTGDVGPQGPQGPQGPRGLSDSISRSEIEAMVAEVLRSSGSSRPNSTQTAKSASNATFETSDCVRVEEVRGAVTFQLQKGTEICDANGTLLGTIKDTYPGSFFVQPPGGSEINCSGGGFTCQFPWDKANRYYIERETEGNNGTVYKMRKKS